MADQNGICDRRCPILISYLGQYPRCAENEIMDLIRSVEGLQSYLPGIEEYLECDVDVTARDLQDLVLRRFKSPDPSAFNEQWQNFYASTLDTISSVRDCISLVECTRGSVRRVLDGLARHEWRERTGVHLAGEQMESLLHYLRHTANISNTNLWRYLDENPTKSKIILQSLISSIRGARNKPDLTKIKPLLFNDMYRLNFGKYINDELINFFAINWTKSSTKSQLLPMNTFFARLVLFQDNQCVKPRTMVDDSVKAKALQYASKIKKILGLAHFEQIFIPINVENTHWYSALIDYSRKKIEIFDSWPGTYRSNMFQPIQQQEYAALMQGLIWLTEILGSLRDGEPIVLLDNVHSGWTWDPHAKVPFQNNGYDCGIYVLWQLKSILEHGTVKSDVPEDPTGDMCSRRLRLLQELLDTCSYNIYREY